MFVWVKSKRSLLLLLTVWFEEQNTLSISSFPMKLPVSFKGNTIWYTHLKYFKTIPKATNESFHFYPSCSIFFMVIISSCYKEESKLYFCDLVISTNHIIYSVISVLLSGVFLRLLYWYVVEHINTFRAYNKQSCCWFF